MPKTPRGKRVPDAAGESFHVVNKAPNGQAEPFFDRTREVWVAPWRKPDGRVGRPTGKTRALAVASRDRHIAKADADERYGALAEGFSAETTVGELASWWLEHVARHGVRPTSLATYRKHVVVIGEKLGAVPVRQVGPEQVTTFVSDLIDDRRVRRSQPRRLRTLLHVPERRSPRTDRRARRSRNCATDRRRRFRSLTSPRRLDETRIDEHAPETQTAK